MLHAISPRGSALLTRLTSPRGVDTMSTHSIIPSPWEVVEVDVPPGPLGILLDGSNKTAAVLEGFAPISSDGTPGAIEASGRVRGTGSILIGVNQYDFEQAQMSFMEIGKVLRETSHLQRVVRFRVPPLVTSPKKPLIASSSPSSSSTGLHDIIDNQTSPVRANTATSPSWSFKGIRSPTASSLSPRPSRSSPRNQSNQQEAATNSRLVRVLAPAGPLGLNLDGGRPDKAWIIGFVPLPDGTKGALELHGGIASGSLLVEISGEDVSTWPLAEMIGRLGALAAEPRELVFRLPDPARAVTALSPAIPPLSTNTSTTPTFIEDLDKRRQLEMALIMKHDATVLKRRECWFMVDLKWMSHWIAFVARGAPIPGPITNHVLLESGWESRLKGELPGRADAPREGLSIMKEYRAVPPMVWCLFVELHGAGITPVLARYVLDIYAPPLNETEVNAVLSEARLKAATLITKLREQCQVQIHR